MTTTERNVMERQASDLLSAVSQFYSPEVSQSVIDHYGDLRSMSRFELEEMTDDLINKMNDLD